MPLSKFASQIRHRENGEKRCKDTRELGLKIEIIYVVFTKDNWQTQNNFCRPDFYGS